VVFLQRWGKVAHDDVYAVFDEDLETDTFISRLEIPNETAQNI
jgi:hypothetical protein